jgi:hypothetical protein
MRFSILYQFCAVHASHVMMMTMIKIIQFNFLLFMCRVNSYKVYYRHSAVQLYYRNNNIIINNNNFIKNRSYHHEEKS